MTGRDSWDSAAQARVSDRWAAASAGWNTAITDALLGAVDLTPRATVLDLAAGSGDPALSIAQQLTDGRVFALDRSGAGLLLAKAQARKLGLAMKVTCIQGDAHGIPLAQGCVDRITCRFGIMFFADTGLVMSEMLRVLRPGGRAALLAWGPFSQPFFDATIALVLERVRGAKMPEAARAMFRFAAVGSLERELRMAGFRDAREERLTLPRVWAGTPQELWAFQQEISTLCHPLFAGIPTDLRREVDREVATALARFQSGKVLKVPVNVVIATGMRAGE